MRYSRTSKETGIEKGEYSCVLAVNSQANTLTVMRGNGEQTTYDPRRQVGVSVYREDEKRSFVGDRIQFTAPSQELKIANRDLGTVESIGRDGTMRLDDERKVEFNPQHHPHVDHGYAVTSYSSQGQTAERVLVNVDTELAAKDLLNSRMAYVSISRGQWDAQIFTNDIQKLAQALGHDVSHKSAYQPEQAISAFQQRSDHHQSIRWSEVWGMGWVCNQDELFIKGANNAGIQRRTEKTTFTSYDTGGGKVAGQSEGGSPTTFHQPTWTRLSDSKPALTDSKDRREGIDPCG